MLAILKAIIPEQVVELFRSPYHFVLQLIAALVTGFPARRLVVIGVTGTKGKSTVADMLFAILTKAGYKTALASTIRFVTPQGEEPNTFKMTMQGRGFIQYFLARALREGATHAIVEITSEGTLQHRHRFLALDALIVTNIQKEHIERHGSYENYVAAKRAIVAELEHSSKANRALVINADIKELDQFMNARVPHKITFSQSELANAPHVPSAGDFNRINALAALRAAVHCGVPETVAREALASLPTVRGRVETIDEGQPFTVVVDYAHTPDSLKALYQAFSDKKLICVLGNTGGGRDRWKRPEMGGIADQMCTTVILTNEDPYDEDPEAILKEMADGMSRSPTIVLDRRGAIREALRKAQDLSIDQNVAVLISGKGTDPYIMGPRGTKTPWSDATVTREELQKSMGKA